MKYVEYQLAHGIDLIGVGVSYHGFSFVALGFSEYALQEGFLSTNPIHLDRLDLLDFLDLLE